MPKGGNGGYQGKKDKTHKSLNSKIYLITSAKQKKTFMDFFTHICCFLTIFPQNIHVGSESGSTGS